MSDPNDDAEPLSDESELDDEETVALTEKALPAEDSPESDSEGDAPASAEAEKAADPDDEQGAYRDTDAASQDQDATSDDQGDPSEDEGAEKDSAPAADDSDSAKDDSPASEEASDSAEDGPTSADPADDGSHEHEHEHEHGNDYDDDDYDDDYTHDSEPPKPRPPRNLAGCLKKALIVVAGLIVLAGIALYVMTRRDPLVTRPETPPQRVLIRNVMVIDVVAGKPQPAMDVLLQGGNIESIAPHSPTAKTAAGTTVIDGTGKSLIPGLIDIHCHLQNSPAPQWAPALPDIDLNFERMLYSGITRAFDPGGMTPDAFEMRASVNDGNRLGPTVYAAGPIFTAPGGHPVAMLRILAPSIIADKLIEGSTRQVGSDAEAKAAVTALMSHKPDFIKFAIDRIPLGVPRLDPAVAAAIVKTAKEHNVRTVAHIGTTQDAIDAGNAGVAAWIHGIYKERIPDDAIDKLVAFKIPMVPTLVVFRSYAEVGRGQFRSTPLEREVAEAELLDARDAIPPDFEVNPDLAKFMMMLYGQRKNSLDNVRRLSEAGVTIMAGSDSQATVVHGPSLHRELVLLSRAGLSPLNVLRAATLHPARFLTQKDDPAFGIVAAGKRADLVLVRGNPLKSVEAISAIDRVFLAGVPLERHPLEE